MNIKMSIILILLTLLVLAGIPGAFARPQYLTNLSAIYGSGSCNTCHVMNQGNGQRGPNGNFGSHASNGTYEPRNFNRTNESRNSNRTFGSQNSSRIFPRNAYGTSFENQPDHAIDPSAALMAIGEPSTAAPDVTAAASAPKTPGFGIVASLVGLFACAFLARRHNK